LSRQTKWLIAEVDVEVDAEDLLVDSAVRAAAAKAVDAAVVFAVAADREVAVEAVLVVAAVVEAARKARRNGFLSRNWVVS
jgi:predicted ABC-type ATPase